MQRYVCVCVSAQHWSLALLSLGLAIYKLEINHIGMCVCVFVEEWFENFKSAIYSPVEIPFGRG